MNKYVSLSHLLWLADLHLWLTSSDVTAAGFITATKEIYFLRQENCNSNLGIYFSKYFLWRTW